MRSRSLLLIALLFSWTATLLSAAESAPRPNIVLIIADDLGAEDCSPYGHTKIRTPSLARLAREGLRFDRAFLTCSSCSPSRSSIITGRYPHSTGAAELHLPLPKTQVTFTEQLRAAGYWTAAAGKWHLGNAIKDRFDLVPDDFDKRAKQGRSAYFDQEPPTMDGSGCEHWLTALRARPKDKPFFLWLAAMDPHRDYQQGAIPVPHRPEDAIVPPYLPDTPAVRGDLNLYYDEVARLDGYVGKVLDELDRQGIAQQTLVVFMTDNGRPFPRCKTTVYDSGVRTPLIARWPGQITPASVSASVVSSVDIAPTFLELAKAEKGPTFQGVSFARLLADPKAETRTEAFSEHNWHDYGAFERSVRTAKYRYIRNSFPNLPGTPPADAVRSPTFQEMRALRDAGKLNAAQMSCFVTPRAAEELYDLESDPQELKNLAADPEHGDTLKALRAKLEAWSKDTDDKVPAAPRKDNFDRESGKPTVARGSVQKE